MAPSFPGVPLPVAATTLLWMKRPFRFMDWCAARYGEPFRLGLAGFPPIAMFYTPDTVKEVFADDGETYAAGKFNRSLAALLGERSVLMLDGKEHMRHRKLLLPPFHGERMQRYGDAMRDLTDACIDRWREGDRFALHPHMQDVTLRVIIRTIFGFEAGPRFDEMVRRTKRILHLGAWPPLLLPFMQKDLGRFSPWGRFRRAVEAGDEYLFEEIRERRRTGARREDVLSLLLDARDEAGEPMTDMDLRDELTTLLVAGHETTATAITWAVRWTLATPGLLDRVRDDLASGQESPLVDAIAREALRLNPVVPLVGRVLERDTRLGGHDLPAGTPITLSIYLAQRRPEVYPEPTKFDPSRFLGKKLSPSEFFPFGGGVRRCIGMTFALYEMRIVLARIFERTDLALVARKPITEERRAITLVPSDGLLVELQRRRQGIARSAVSATSKSAGGSTSNTSRLPVTG